MPLKLSIQLNLCLFILISNSLLCSCSDPQMPSWSRAYLKQLDVLLNKSLLNTNRLPSVNPSNNLDSSTLTQTAQPTQSPSLSSAKLFQNLSISPPWPSFKDRKLSVDFKPTLSFRSFLSIQGCELGHIIGLRNSSLGRVITSSQRLIYEKRFLWFAPRCLQSDGLSPKLYKELAKVIEHKKQLWPIQVWNATWGSREWAYFFSFSWPKGRLPRDFGAFEESTFLSLAQWIQDPSLSSTSQVKKTTQLKETLKKQSAQFEEHLKALKTKVGGRVLKESQEIFTLLRVSQNQLSRVQKSQCTHLNQLFETYTRKIQPLLSQRLQNHSQLIHAIRPFTTPLLQVIHTHFQLSPPTSLKRWMTYFLLTHPSDSLFPQLKQLSLVHVALFKKLYASSSCSR